MPAALPLAGIQMIWYGVSECCINDPRFLHLLLINKISEPYLWSEYKHQGVICQVLQEKGKGFGQVFS
jgi:hypothetical protein